MYVSGVHTEMNLGWEKTTFLDFRWGNESEILKH